MKTSLMKGRKPIMLKFALFASALTLASNVSADSPLDPAAYVAVDQQIKQLTVDGMAARVQALQGHPYDREGQMNLSDNVQDSVGQVLSGHGVTMTNLLNYGAQHEEDVEAWLDEHPDQQDIYDDISRQRDALTAQLKALQE